jgi:hypothetical protein
MKENEKNQESISLPPPWCGAICRNAMNEVCIEHCAIKRDCSFFEAKPNLKLIDMPRFPDTRGMTKEEKFTSVTIYLAKVVDHLQGAEDEYPYRRPNIHDPRGSLLPQNVQIKDLLPHKEEEVPSHPDTEKRESETQRPPEVVGSSD